MWIRKPEYLVKDNLPTISRHDQLPMGCILLGQTFDKTENDNWLFIKNQEGLSITQQYEKTLKNGRHIYRCHQRDFPMEFLAWFAKALEDFQKSPVDGGLPAGAMTSADQNVGGEMLCIQRAMAVNRDGGGYAVLNRSRCKRGNDINTEFEPHEIVWSDNFLYEEGVLDLIKDLAEKSKQDKV